jgi:tripeptide aminopeptidase
MLKCLENAADKHGALLKYDVDEVYASYNLDHQDDFIEFISKVCQSLDLEVSKLPSGGGSDANIYNKNGIKAVVIGSGMDLVHTNDERLCIKDFHDAAKVVLKMMTV